MDLREAQEMARVLFEEWGLNSPTTITFSMPGSSFVTSRSIPAWSFAFDTAVKRFGCCQWSRNRITLSKQLVLVNTTERVKNTLLHEIAHALAGPYQGHNHVWAAKCALVGIPAVRCYSSENTVAPVVRYRLRCPLCGSTHALARATTRRFSCKICMRKGIDRIGAEMVFELNPDFKGKPIAKREMRMYTISLLREGQSPQTFEMEERRAIRTYGRERWEAMRWNKIPTISVSRKINTQGPSYSPALSIEGEEPRGNPLEYPRYGFRKGDPVDYAESLTRHQGGRGTGHFGSGTYMFSSREKAEGYDARSGRAVSLVDLQGKKMFKPLTEQAAFRLHRVLQKLNDMAFMKEDLNAYKELVWDFKHGAGLMGVTPKKIGMACRKVRHIMKEAYGRGQYGVPRDTASTRLMKSLGYEGIDVRHLPDFDNSDYGSVLYKSGVIENPPLASEVAKERREHPSLPMKTIKRIVADHSKTHDNPGRTLLGRKALEVKLTGGHCQGNFGACYGLADGSTFIKGLFTKVPGGRVQYISYMDEAKAKREGLNPPDRPWKHDFSSLDVVAVRCQGGILLKSKVGTPLWGHR
jgi:predicted SprT family Zn-dependent metalloprotease